MSARVTGLEKFVGGQECPPSKWEKPILETLCNIGYHTLARQGYLYIE